MSYRWKSSYRGVDKVFRDFIFLYVIINLSLMVAVVTQCIKDLCKGKVGKMNNNLLRGKSQSPVLYNCPDWRPCSFDDRFTA